MNKVNSLLTKQCKKINNFTNSNLDFAIFQYLKEKILFKLLMQLMFFKKNCFDDFFWFNFFP